MNRFGSASRTAPARNHARRRHDAAAHQREAQHQQRQEREDEAVEQAEADAGGAAAVHLVADPVRPPARDGRRGDEVDDDRRHDDPAEQQQAVADRLLRRCRGRRRGLGGLLAHAADHPARDRPVPGVAIRPSQPPVRAQDPHRADGGPPAPLEPAGRRPVGPVHVPAAVVALLALQAVEVGLDDGGSMCRRIGRPGSGARSRGRIRRRRRRAAAPRAMGSRSVTGRRHHRPPGRSPDQGSARGTTLRGCPRARSATRTRSASARRSPGGRWSGWRRPSRGCATSAPSASLGDTVTAAEAVGKHHILRFASGRVLWSHLMMNGVWRLLPASRTPRPGGLFLALWTEQHVAALYRCPTVRLLEPGEPLPRAVLATGPDLLGADVDPGRAAAERLARVEPTRQVGEVLMDQRVVSRDRQRLQVRDLLPHGHRPVAAGREPHRRRGRRHRRGGRPAARPGRPGRRAHPHVAAARRAAVEPGAHLGVRPPRPPLPAVRHPDPLARPGRRQPHHLLVPHLPALRALRSGHQRRVVVAAAGAAHRVDLLVDLRADQQRHARQEQEDQVDGGTGEGAVDRLVLVEVLDVEREEP